MFLLRGFCVIIAVLGLMAVISPVLWPETTSPGFTVLGVVMLVAGAAGFVLLGRREAS